MNALHQSAPGRVKRLETLFSTPIPYRRFPAAQMEQVLLLFCETSGISHRLRTAAGLRELLIWSNKTNSFAAFWATWAAANGCNMCHVPTHPKDLPWKPSCRSSLVARGLGWGCLGNKSAPHPALQIVVCLSHHLPAATCGIKINKHW